MHRYLSSHCEEALLRGPVKPTVLSHGMTEVKLLHATMPPRNDVNLLIDLLLVNNTSQRTSRKVLQQ
ncbi:hypothetical protein [Rickettsia argasii]|uniref:hypothetical protein n=1 Tax=Rickettsia argasii TaxID=1441385 RepID=UPI0011B9409D|nr:hypothetical protein [Rickettsia argasii]